MSTKKDATAPATTARPLAQGKSFSAALAFIDKRGRAPVPFLEELVNWGRTAPAEIFAPNRVPNDAYAVIKPYLATLRGNDASGTPIYVWESALHRRAAMLELMRVHAGRESSWKWGEGVDRTNARSQQDPRAEEAGIFQVSFDSTNLDSEEGQSIMAGFAKAHGLTDPAKFIPAMKENHALAMEYYARLVRVSIRWAGPLIRHGADSVFPYLNRDAMREFWGMLK